MVPHHGIHIWKLLFKWSSALRLKCGGAPSACYKMEGPFRWSINLLKLMEDPPGDLARFQVGTVISLFH